MPSTPWKIWKKLSKAEAIAEGLKIIPTHWALTPLQEKKPYRTNWQEEQAVSRELIANALLKGSERVSTRTGKTYRSFASGFGLRTGEVSGGIICLDIDGASAEPLLNAISGGDLPHTIAWTSGKKGRRQLAYQIPDRLREELKYFTRSVITDWEGLKSDSGEILEIRYNECQSVLPPSLHPDTGAYKWINSPEDTKLAIAPDWLYELVINFASTEEQKEKSSDRVATDPTLDPYDIRNLAFYLEGYNPRGRRKGWITCKCPAHGGTSADSLHIEESTGAYKCWADCNPKDIHKAALENAIASGAELPKRRGSRGISLNEVINLLKKQAKKETAKWGFGKKEEAAPEVKLKQKIISFSKGKRLKKYRELARKFKYILDSSATGSGKTYDLARINPSDFGMNHAIYVTNDPRNPSDEVLRKEWQLLDGRNPGLKKDALGKWRRVKPGEASEVKPNCSRNQTIEAIRSYGIRSADHSDLICKGCNYFEACRAGREYGYLNARSSALSTKDGESKKIRSHPSSLPSTIPIALPNGTQRVFPYEQTILIWDEAAESLRNRESISFNVRDLEKLISHLIVYPELLANLQPLLSKLKDLLSGTLKQPNKFGWTHHQLIEMLPKCNVDLAALAEATHPDLSLLNPVAEYGVSISSLPARDRSHFNEDDKTTAENLKTSLLKQWILPLLSVLSGEVGCLFQKGKEFTISYQSSYLPSIAHQSGVNIFLDATGDVDQLAAILGVDPSEIAVVQEAVQEASPSANNLEITQVAGLGRLGISRGADQQRRVEAVLKELNKRHPDAATFRFKRDAQAGELRHFGESRGLNDAQQKRALIIDGIACENLESLRAKFACIYKYVPSDECEDVEIPFTVNEVIRSDGTRVEAKDQRPTFKLKMPTDQKFADFVRQHILATIHQEIGRLRANRRPNEKLTVYILGDYPLDVPVTWVQAKHLTAEAASKTERVSIAVERAIAQLQEKGLKPTQKAISELVGITQQHVCRLLKKITHFALSNPQSKMCKSEIEDPPPLEPPEECDEETIGYFAQTYLPALASDRASDVATQLEIMFCGYADIVFREIWDRSPVVTQIEIMVKLFSLLPLRQLEVLIRGG